MESQASQSILTPILKKIRRRQTNRNDTIKNQLVVETVYSNTELKLLVFLGLLHKFDQRKIMIRERYEKESEQKLKNRSMHVNKFSRTVVIEPTNKKILELNSTSEIFQHLQKLLIIYLKLHSHRPLSIIKNSSHVQFVHNSSSNLGVVEQSKIQNEKINRYQLSIIHSALKYQNTYHQSAKKQQHKNDLLTVVPSRKFHKKYQSDYLNDHINIDTVTAPSNIVQIENNKQNKEKISIKRKEIYFIRKKKQEVNSLWKMAICLSVGKNQYRSFGEMVEIFTKNANRGVQYTKIVEQNANKCKKINIYLIELNQVYQQMLNIYQVLQKYDNSFKLRSMNKKKQQTINLNHPLPSICQFYQKSTQILKTTNRIALSPNLFKILASCKKSYKKLIEFMIQARYILIHLQKQIQHIEMEQRFNDKISTWEKIYIEKFVLRKMNI